MRWTSPSRSANLQNAVSGQRASGLSTSQQLLRSRRKSDILALSSRTFPRLWIFDDCRDEPESEEMPRNSSCPESLPVDDESELEPVFVPASRGRPKHTKKRHGRPFRAFILAEAKDRARLFPESPTGRPSKHRNAAPSKRSTASYGFDPAGPALVTAERYSQSMRKVWPVFEAIAEPAEQNLRVRSKDQGGSLPVGSRFSLAGQSSGFGAGVAENRSTRIKAAKHPEVSSCDTSAPRTHSSTDTPLDVAAASARRRPRRTNKPGSAKTNCLGPL